MMKKIISLLICSVFLILSFPQNIIAEDEMLETAYSKEFDVISQLGILPDSVLQKAETEENITRAEFAAILYNMMVFASHNEDSEAATWWKGFYGEYDINSPAKLQETNAVFADVDSNTDYYNEISWVTTFGFLCSDGNEFKPDEEVIYIDTLDVILKMLGLGRLINNEGGYPNGVLKYGSEYKLYMKNATEAMSVFDISKLIYSALKKEVMEAKLIDGDFLYIKSDLLFMEKVLNLAEFKGIMLDNGVISLNGAQVGKNRIVIGDKTFDCNLDCEGYLGKRVSAYVSVSDNARDTVFAIEEYKNNTIVEINAKDVIEYRDSSIYYDLNGKEKRIKLNNALLVYNGYVKDNWIKEDFDFTDGTVTVIDNGSDCDVVIVENYQNVFVSWYDSDNHIIYNKAKDKTANNGDESFDLTNALNEEKLYISYADGTKATVADIKSGIVVDIIYNRAYAKLIISNNKESNVIVKSQNKSAEEYKGCFIIGGEKEYYVSKKILEAFNGCNIETGKTYTLYFNRNNIVVWIEAETKSELSVGYYIKGYVDEEIDDSFVIKMLNENGNVVRIKVAEKVTFVDENGVKDRTTTERVEQRMNGFEGIFSYKLNENDNTITSIEIPQINHKNDTLLKKIYDSKGTEIMFKGDHFQNELFVNRGMKVFFVPSDTEDKLTDGNYRVGTLEELKGDGNYDVAGYTRSYDTRVAQVLVCREGSGGVSEQFSLGELKNCILVQEIYDGLDNDDNACKIVKGQTLATWDTSSESFIGYAPYDVTDASGNTVTAFDVAYDLPNSTGSDSLKNTYQIQKGDIIRVIKKVNTDIVKKAELLYGINRVNPDFPRGRTGWFAGTRSNITGGTDNYTNPYNHVYYSTISPTAPKKWDSGRRIFCGFVYDLEDSILEITTKDLSVNPLYDRESEEYYTEWRPVLNTVNVINVSKDNYSLKIGGEGDIKTYKNAGDNCSRIIAGSVGAKDQIMIIINE